MPAKITKRIIKNGSLQAVLIACLACPISIRGQEGKSKTVQSRSTDPYVILLENQQFLNRQNEQLRNDIAELRLTLKGMAELQAKLSLTKDDQKGLLEIELKKAATAATQLGTKTDFGSTEGEVFRKQLKGIADEIRNKTIDSKTSKEDVTNFIAKIEDAQDLIKTHKKKAEASFRKSLRSIENSPLGNLIRNKKLQEDDLKKIERKKLLDAVSKLDPGISPESLSKLEKDSTSLYAKILSYSQGGKLTPELIAAFGDDLAKLAGVEKLSEDAKKFIEDAKTVVDVNRAGADFASFAVSTMQAAISTGNPYVIAAAAAIIILIALFKALFGGGGGNGGDGDGDGEGNKKGKKQRKTEHGDVPGQDEDIDRNQPTGIPSSPSSPPPPPPPPPPSEDGGKQPGSAIVMPPGVTGKVIQGTDPKAPFIPIMTSTSLVIADKEKSTVLAEVKVANVSFIDPNKGGVASAFNFQPGNIIKVTGYNKEKNEITLQYKTDNGKEAEARLSPQAERPGMWLITGPLI